MQELTIHKKDLVRGLSLLSRTLVKENVVQPGKNFRITNGVNRSQVVLQSTDQEAITMMCLPVLKGVDEKYDVLVEPVLKDVVSAVDSDDIFIEIVPGKGFAVKAKGVRWDLQIQDSKESGFPNFSPEAMKGDISQAYAIDRLSFLRFIKAVIPAVVKEESSVVSGILLDKGVIGAVSQSMSVMIESTILDAVPSPLYLTSRIEDGMSFIEHAVGKDIRVLDTKTLSYFMSVEGYFGMRKLEVNKLDLTHLKEEVAKAKYIATVSVPLFIRALKCVGILLKAGTVNIDFKKDKGGRISYTDSVGSVVDAEFEASADQDFNVEVSYEDLVKFVSDISTAELDFLSGDQAIFLKGDFFSEKKKIGTYCGELLGALK